MIRPTLLLVLLLLLCLPLASTRAAPREKGDDDVCAGTPGLAVSAARHLDFQRRLERQRREGAVPGKATRVYADRKVAVIQGDESLVSPPVAFDLAHRGIQFLPRQDGYAARSTYRPLFTTIGERVELDDTDSVAVALPGWQFPFFGESYGSVYVDADGNLTFGASGADWRHDFLRFLNGPPRIAVFYADLYPPGAHGEAGVYVRTFPNRLRVTWLRVPRWSDGKEISAQVTLFASGRIQLLYGDLTDVSAIVGISPGGGEERLELLDYDVELPHPPLEGAIAEQFSEFHNYDELGVARTFYQHFQDRYDFLIIFLDFPHKLLGGAANAYYSTFQNFVQGIAREIVDQSDLAGSDGVLQGIVHMGSTDIYPEDPDEVFRHIHTPLSLLAHEMGHRWLTTVSFRDRNGNDSSALRASGISAHWSFYFDSDASPMLGNEILDNGDGTFLTVGGPRRYSDLDLYLMGLLPPEAVRDFFYVTNVPNPISTDSKPRGDYTFRGDRVDVGIDQVIAVEGPRIPSSVDSRRHFRTAFLLLTADGARPRPEALRKLQRLRRRWMQYFPEITRGEATVATALRPKSSSP